MAKFGFIKQNVNQLNLKIIRTNIKILKAFEKKNNLGIEKIWLVAPAINGWH